MLLGWLMSPVVLGSVCILLAFLLVVVQGQRGRYIREMAHFKEEWLRYRREMQAKVKRARHYESYLPLGRIRWRVEKRIGALAPRLCPTEPINPII